MVHFHPQALQIFKNNILFSLEFDKKKILLINRGESRFVSLTFQLTKNTWDNEKKGSHTSFTFKNLKNWYGFTHNIRTSIENKVKSVIFSSHSRKGHKVPNRFSVQQGIECLACPVTESMRQPISATLPPRGSSSVDLRLRGITRARFTVEVLTHTRPYLEDPPRGLSDVIWATSPRAHH